MMFRLHPADPLRKGDQSGLAQILYLLLRIIVLVVRLPRKTNDYLMIFVVGVDFIVGNIFVYQTVCYDGFGGRHICDCNSRNFIFRYIRRENGLNTTLDVDTPPNVIGAFKDDVLCVAVVVAHPKNET